MPSLRDKLGVYKKEGKKRAISRPSPETFGAEKLKVDGAILWRFSSSFNLKDEAERLGLLPHDDISAFARHNGIDPALAFSDLLFLDLETTSLSTASGSYAFLFGTGREEKGKLLIEQYFMEDYSAEPAILKHLLPGFLNQTLVTYNGKSFDIPLLKTRYRMNRIQGFPVEKKSIDLLHPSRGIFKSIYENCSLTTLEEKLLGVTREKDIPSWLIPEVYFSYQNHGETDRMELVVEHHRYDIASMALLMLFLNRVYSLVDSRNFDALHRRSVINIAGRLYRKEPELFIDMARFLGEDILLERPLFRKFSSAMKRLGRREEIQRFWERDASVFSLEELAKQREHVEKDFGKALSHCEKALAFLDKGQLSENGERMGDDIIAPHRKRFEGRRMRLKGKMGKSKDAGMQV